MLSAKLPVVSPEAMTTESYLEHMQVDKKVLDGRIRLVLLESIGKAMVTSDITREQIEATLMECGAA
jgi:3-dehydroquinate synthase